MDIRLNHLSKQFEGKTIFKELNLVFPEGRISFLMGASGVGKTTLLNIILGLQKPDTGEVLGCTGKRIAALFQEDRLIEHWDAVKNIKLVCESTVTEERIIHELNEIGITDVKNKAVKDFSGGMRRRVALVRAILAKSDIIIMDEPFKGLDNTLKAQVMEYVKKNTSGKTIIIVSHEKEDVNQLEAQLLLI